MKRKIKEKIIAGSLIATTLAAALSGCSNEEQKYTDADSYYSSIANNEHPNKAAVVICNNEVLVFLSDYYILDSIYKTVLVYGSDEFYNNYCELAYSNKEELEAKIKVLVGDDAQIHYQEEYTKVKRK